MKETRIKIRKKVGTAHEMRSTRFEFGVPHVRVTRGNNYQF